MGDRPEYGLAHRGVICLQDHGYPASFRNLKIKELPRKAGREVELFNGRDLTGWEAYGTEKWYVDDAGNLVSESGPDKKYGYLATREYYNDFDLTLEFKQLANGNSGLFFRSFVEPPVKVHGWQCEVAPRNHDTAGIYESYGRGWLQPFPTRKSRFSRRGIGTRCGCASRATACRRGSTARRWRTSATRKSAPRRDASPCRFTTEEASRSSGATSGLDPVVNKRRFPHPTNRCFL